MASFKHFHVTFVYFSSCCGVQCYEKETLIDGSTAQKFCSKLLILKVEPLIHRELKAVLQFADTVQ